MIDRQTLRTAGYICLTVGVVGCVVNVITFLVLVSHRKLRGQVTTIIILFITAVNIIYSGVDLPLHATAFMNCKYCSADNVYCSLGAFTFYATTGSTLFLQAVLAITRYNFVCSLYRVEVGKCLVLCIAGTLTPFIICSVPFTGLWGQYGYEEGTGTCTVLPGSYKISIQIVGVCLPYLVISFCYVMIIRKYRKSKNKVLGKSSSIKPNDIIETSAPSRRMSLFEKFSPKQRVDETSFCEAGPSSTSLFPPRTKVNEDDISDCGASNYDFLRRHRTERLKRRRKQEVDMTVTVLVTCVTFIVCNIPATLLLVLDPSASSFPEAHVPSYALVWINPVLSPIIYVAFNLQYRQAFLHSFQENLNRSQ